MTICPLLITFFLSTPYVDNFVEDQTNCHPFYLAMSKKSGTFRVVVGGHYTIVNPTLQGRGSPYGLPPHLYYKGTNNFFNNQILGPLFIHIINDTAGGLAQGYAMGVLPYHTQSPYGPPYASLGWPPAPLMAGRIPPYQRLLRGYNRGTVL